MKTLKTIFLTTGISLSSFSFSASAPEILNLRGEGFGRKGDNNHDFDTQRMFWATKNKNLMELRSSLGMGANVTAKDKGEENRTALHIAVIKGWTQGVQELLRFENRPDLFINAQDKKGLTALHYAAKNGFNEVVNCLLSSGIEVHTELKSYLYHQTAAEVTVSESLALTREASFWGARAQTSYDIISNTQLKTEARLDPMIQVKLDKAHLNFDINRRTFKTLLTKAENCNACIIAIEAYKLKRQNDKVRSKVFQEHLRVTESNLHKQLAGIAFERVSNEEGVATESFYRRFKPKKQKQFAVDSQELQPENPRSFGTTPEPYPYYGLEQEKPRAIALDPDLEACDDAYAPRGETFIIWTNGEKRIEIRTKGPISFDYDPNEEW